MGGDFESFDERASGVESQDFCFRAPVIYDDRMDQENSFLRMASIWQTRQPKSVMDVMRD